MWENMVINFPNILSMLFIEYFMVSDKITSYSIKLEKGGSPKKQKKSLAVHSIPVN